MDTDRLTFEEGVQRGDEVLELHLLKRVQNVGGDERLPLRLLAMRTCHRGDVENERTGRLADRRSSLTADDAPVRKLQEKNWGADGRSSSQL